MVPGENMQLVPLEGMCVTTEKNERKSDMDYQCYCIFRDMSNCEVGENQADAGVLKLPIGSGRSKKKYQFLNPSITATNLMQFVGQLFSYDPQSFELHLQVYDENVRIHEYTTETLEELGAVIGAKKKNFFTICSKKNTPPKKVPLENFEAQIDNLKASLNAMGYTNVEFIPAGPFASLASAPLSSSSSSPSKYNSESSSTELSCNYSNVSPVQEIGFVGLVNQAMTCYLNSFLQTLFMTPEFRNALYRWEFDGTEEEGTKSIPFQLQKLFLQLQTSKKSAVGTVELTTSFGWDGSEAWQQHDVQELCRVMFDALEYKFKNTQQADLISRLYEGKLKDYVKCLECGYESAREDTFLDVPLVVRPFGSSQAYSSVGEALQAFVTPEILQGSNQYFCEHCNKKCDAHKGLKFIKFPYLLTLQLKRFDFDPLTMHRIKLNDRVVFPEILNLNDFIKSDSNQEICDDGDTTDSGSALDDEGIACASGYKTGCSLSPEAISDNDLPDDDEGIDVGPHGTEMNELCANERNIKKYLEKGPYVYELFSIMVHSGSANGGHYYAYIKSFKLREWYCFNDAHVTRITYDDIQKTYGGGPSRGYYSSAYSSSTNAYMLLYRQIDKEKNAECMSPDEFPEHIKALLQCMQEQEERERLVKELDVSMCKINLFCQHPVHQRKMERKLKVHKDCSLAEATATAHTIMGLEGVVPVECCRLVKYDEFSDSLCSFDPNTGEPIGELLGGVKSYSTYKDSLFLEIKKPNEQFQDYKPGDTAVDVCVVDLEQEIYTLACTIRSHPNITIGDLKKQIADTLGVDGSEMRIVMAYCKNKKLLDDPSKLLCDVGYKTKNKVLVEYKDAADAKKPYDQSKLCQVLSHICLHIKVPKVDKETLDRLRLCDSNESRYDSCSEEEDNAKTDYFDDQPIGICSKKYELDLVLSKKVREIREREKKERGKRDSELDEGLGDSEMGDSTSSNSFHSNHQSIYSDQSEDSSLTDSERTLIGDELSPRNNSPDVMDSEMEQDIEPLHSDIEVSKPECDVLLTNSGALCPVHGLDDSRNMSSPEENTKYSKCSVNTENCKNLCTCAENKIYVPEPLIKRFFKSFTRFDQTGEKYLQVYADERMTLAELKKELEPHVGVSASCFKIFKEFLNRQSECTDLKKNLSSFSDDCELVVQLGRSLRKGEYKVAIFQLCVNESEPIKYLIDHVLVKGMTVLEAKKEILPIIKEKCDLTIPLNRCRLRKKSWKNPGPIYFDNLRFGKEIIVNNSNWEMYLEVLEDAEPFTPKNKVFLFTRMWHPSTFMLDPFIEISLEELTAEALRKKLSEISQVPEEFIMIAMGLGTFPCEVSILNIHKDLEWKSPNSFSFIFSIMDDGLVIYYRDSREELKTLSKQEINTLATEQFTKELTRCRPNKNIKPSYSPRKEKALKIYTVDDDTSNSASSSDRNAIKHSALNSQKSHKFSPDLD